MIRRRTPIRRASVRIQPKPLRKPVNLAYRAWLRLWPCFLCFKRHCEMNDIPFWQAAEIPEARELFYREFSLAFCGITQACHVGSKGTGQLCPEREIMPLGFRHHMHPTAGGFKDSHHAGTRTFWTKHDLSRPHVLEFLRHLYVAETGREI